MKKTSPERRWQRSVGSSDSFVNQVELRSYRLGSAVLDFLNRPSLVAICAFGLALAILIFDGSLYRLWSLERDRAQIENRIQELNDTLKHKEQELKQTRKLDYLEAQARENLDLVKEGEMVFVFPDPTENEASN